MMKIVSWFIGLGVVAFAVVRWSMSRQNKSTWEKAVDWTSDKVSPMSRAMMKTGKKVVRMVR